ncbi:radical SAM protein [uncultured Paludibaculum sp.]|uniref:radical SAM protein n=1 Tax=uncultured Paludibaculum sp. TaxID=1765020 RepID=UPI002AAB4002|nr:radical SAM protein [uncultured Paludibaculum sp.]
MQIDTDQEYRRNLDLSQAEYEQRRIHLLCRPRCLGLVLGNACNLRCIHCYQAKDGGSLLQPPEVGAELRRELAAFYPYLSTLRIQGGEVFAIRGFRELIDDVAAMVQRPLLSISTNGTLIDDAWAERLVSGPFSNVTVSIDGGTGATYNRLRRGADLDQVLANIDRVQQWKSRLDSSTPYLDSFFVVMRSNFREIPQYLELMRQHGMIDVTLQTMELSAENLARNPDLEAQELISERSEVEELHELMRAAVPAFRPVFRTLRVSGLQSLFASHGLDTGFLEESRLSLYPDSDGLSTGAFELCPNPWTTLFVTENGDVRLCFMAGPIGNLYAESLSSLWNSREAAAMRRGVIAGRYLESGCSRQYCGWREGHAAEGLVEDGLGLRDMELARQEAGETPRVLGLVRRRVSEERRKRGELEAVQRSLEAQIELDRAEIDRLAARVRSLELETRESELLLELGRTHIAHLEDKANHAVDDFRNLEAEFQRTRAPWFVRAVRWARRWLAAQRPG